MFACCLFCQRSACSSLASSLAEWVPTMSPIALPCSTLASCGVQSVSHHLPLLLMINIACVTSFQSVLPMLFLCLITSLDTAMFSGGSISSRLTGASQHPRRRLWIGRLVLCAISCLPLQMTLHEERGIGSLDRHLPPSAS